MKPDGVNMETPEPTETAVEAEHSSSQDNVTEQAPSQPAEAANDAAPVTAPKANGKPVAAEPKVKSKAVGSKTQATAKSAGVSGSSSRPGTALQRQVNDVKSSNNVSAAAGKKITTTAKAAAAAASSSSSVGAVPKRPGGVTAGSSIPKNQSRVADKKPVGPARTTSVAAATVTNGTKPTTTNGTPKRRPATETVNGARPKTTGAASRTVSSTAPKPNTSTITKAVGAASSKTTRPATAPATSRPTSTTSRTTAPTKPSTTATAKAAASRVTTAPSTGRTTAAQPPKTTAAAKKDVSRPPSTAVAKKPTTAPTSAAAKNPEPAKPMGTAKLNAASKWSTTTKAADAKVSQSKPQQPAKPALAKKPVAPVRFPALNKPFVGRSPPASPANKPVNSGTSKTKLAPKPTQTVRPFTATKKTKVSNTTTPAVETWGGAAAAAAAAAAATPVVALAATQAEATAALLRGSSASAPEEVPTPVLAQDTTPVVAPQEATQSHEAAPSPPQSPVRTTSPRTSPPTKRLESSPPPLTAQEQIPSPAHPTLSPVAFPSDTSKETLYLLTDQTPSTSTAPSAAATAIPQMDSPTNLNEEEDEEEREGSQVVSVSEMSGTTQPTEESRPGSAGPVGGSAWRASGALLSELDSEEVSGSQQGASELSAPGVLEGTESMDDLGDGSLKGAIDMEGASAGSPDFEKVPDIPVNDFDEDEDEDEDDYDRVCDMDVGSERADEPQRPRHDNDVEEEEEEEEEDDDDVEMASEGVTESGLESYGNADEDDFAEDERLDNLNRVAQPPPPPMLPSAPAAQWDQPNPFADPWAEPLEPLQVEGEAAANPLADSWHADSETPTQTSSQAWLEMGSAPFVPENQEVPYHSPGRCEPQNLEAQMCIDQSSPAPIQTLAPAVLSAPGMSLSSFVSSETSTLEELGDYNRDRKLQSQAAQAPMLSPQPDLDYQDLGIHLDREDKEEEEEAEPETLPADEVLGGPATAPTSNPSSSSVTEDEASDTEGETQLDDSLDSPAVGHATFDGQSAAQRSLSTVEEGEEADMSEAVGGAGGDATPPSATSLASYGFDTTTTASNSNAQSTGESCIKSPGIFSLEELPEEAKDPGLALQPVTQPRSPEQQYIECGKQEAGSAEQVGEEAAESEEAPNPSLTRSTLQQPEEDPDSHQSPYYSTVCEKNEDPYAGFTALTHPHRRDHSAYPRTYYDIVKPIAASVAPPKLTCADLPPRSAGQKALSPQLRRLEQHQRQLLELQHRREQQSRPLEEAEPERKRREEEEQRRKKEEAEEEIKRNKEEEEASKMKMKKQAEAKKKEEEQKRRKEEELKQRRDLQLQLQQQQEELKQRQQIMQWQQELQESKKGQTVVLSPSSGLCTIYEALENSEEEAEDEEEEIDELNPVKGKKEPKRNTSRQEKGDRSERVMSDQGEHRDSSPSASPPPLPDSLQSSNPSQGGDGSSPRPPESPERPPPLDLDWGKKVDIVQQLINQTLMLNGDGCSSLLLLPGGAGGTLSPLESSLWPSLLPPLTPPSATVTSVSSFSPEATGSSPQGEWTVVELETHH